MLPLKSVDPAELENAEDGRDGLEDDEAVPDASVGKDRLLWLDVVLPETLERCPARLTLLPPPPAVAAATPGFWASCEMVRPFMLRCIVDDIHHKFQYGFFDCFSADKFGRVPWPLRPTRRGALDALSSAQPLQTHVLLVGKHRAGRQAAALGSRLYV